MNKFTRTAAIALACGLATSGVVHADTKNPAPPPPACKEGATAGGGIMVCKGGKWTIPIIDKIVKKPLPKMA